MLTKLLYTIISTIHFIFSTPWLGMFFIQDNGIEDEYWVYFDDYGHIGQIDTSYFIFRKNR